MKKHGIGLFFLILAAALVWMPGRTLAGEEAPAEETEYAAFIGALREAVDARRAAGTEEDLYASFEAEYERMEEYESVRFEDERLNETADLYFLSLDAVRAAGAFEKAPLYRDVLADAALSQYSVALLTLSEDYGLPLEGEEIKEFRDRIGISVIEEETDPDGERITIGGCSYVIPEGFVPDGEDTTDEEYAFVSQDETQQLMIYSEGLEGELGEYAFIGPMMLEVMFASLEEEFADDDVVISETKVLGFDAMRIEGQEETEDGPANVVMVATVTDTDLVMLGYYDLAPDAPGEGKLDFDAWIGKIRKAEEENPEEVSEEAQEEAPEPEEEGAGAAQTAEEVMEQLVFEVRPTAEKDVAVLFITNGSDTVIDDLSVKVNFLDDSGTVVDQDSDRHDMILPGSTVVSRLDWSSGLSRYEIESDIKIGSNPRYENHAESVEAAANPGEKCVIVKLTNNDDVSIDEIEYAVVLYKGDEVVWMSYPTDIYDLGPGKSTTEKVDGYGLAAMKYGEDYDRIEVYLNQAHTFGL